ncbi:NAD-dependent epimerase/dehydratase family protein [Cumulibacter manganitolerans]|uniref:NAD-dependent epimerase/dehydratase family protein n=1 Tax=Cumulibacter manganitolerans TaxID=1884992 RepID=UPI001296B613|nr:NAD-dependent epimerase/dehydratase family protein [Cumulibacter manganitolerans]
MPKTVLIAGASGLVGTACVDAFLDRGWDVVAVSRRRPEVTSDRPFTHLPLNLQDPQDCRNAVRDLAGVTHVVYAAVSEKPGLIAGWQDPDQMQVNLAMLRNLVGPLSDVAALEHVTLLQGTKAYGGHLHPMPVPARERFPRDDHANFYWLQEDYLRELADRRGFAWTILRPVSVLGPNYGVAMNVIPVIGAYAAICRETGAPFGYPGHVGYVQQAVDVRLVAGAAFWAADASQARFEYFNLSNGEVFSWRDLWPAVADTLGVDIAPDHPVSLADFLPAPGETWQRIVARHGLRPLEIAEVLGESHHFADRNFGYGLREQPAPRLVSTIKVKQAGFTDTMDTEESVRHWLRVLMQRRVIPSP